MRNLRGILAIIREYEREYKVDSLHSMQYNWRCWIKVLSYLDRNSILYKTAKENIYITVTKQ